MAKEKRLFVFGTQNYEEDTRNYGDCALYVDDWQAIIYDCGSVEHAKRVIDIMDEYGVEKAVFILSHNDSDHFDGISTLIEANRIDAVFTTLLLKYKDDLYEIIDDKRLNKKTIAERILETYDNIASLSKRVSLHDIYENEDVLPSCIKRIGPDFDYMLDAVAKGLDNTEGDTIDNETIINATSIQLELMIGENTVLLTGDSPSDAIPSNVNLSQFSYIQLPHHGKALHAEAIWERAKDNNDIIYIVSDNTGNSNGGSDKLKTTGHRVENTKNGDIIVPCEKSTSYCRRKLGS